MAGPSDALVVGPTPVQISEQLMKYLNGPATNHDKIIYMGLKRKGVPDNEIPVELQDSPVAKSRKGPIGSIVLRRMTGLETNSTKRIVDQFEDNIGGKDNLAEGLEAVKEHLPKAQILLLDILKKGSPRSLARLVAESHVEPVALMRNYAKGVMELGRVKAAIEAHKDLPALIKDLYCHALSKVGVCDACGGQKMLAKPNGKDNGPCYFCAGTGIKSQSDLKKFATEKLLEVTGQVQKGPLVAVQTNVGVNVSGQKGSVHEKMMAIGDDILYKRIPQATNSEPVVEAEVVSQ